MICRLSCLKRPPLKKQYGPCAAGQLGDAAGSGPIAGAAFRPSKFARRRSRRWNASLLTTALRHTQAINRKQPACWDGDAIPDACKAKENGVIFTAV